VCFDALRELWQEDVKIFLEVLPAGEAEGRLSRGGGLLFGFSDGVTLEICNRAEGKSVSASQERNSSWLGSERELSLVIVERWGEVDGRGRGGPCFGKIFGFGTGETRRMSWCQ